MHCSLHGGGQTNITVKCLTAELDTMSVFFFVRPASLDGSLLRNHNGNLFNIPNFEMYTIYFPSNQ